MTTIKKIMRADKENARFKWKINLIDTSKQEYIIGYSKMINNAEAADRFTSFKNKIIMLHQKGYIDKAQSIEFIDNQNLDTLTILQNDKHSTHPKLIASKEYEFLNKFYERRNNNLDMNFFNAPKIAFSKQQYLTPQNVGHLEPNNFFKYCTELSAMGFETFEINEFKTKYQLMYGKYK